jgi:hypothetical protein
MDLFARQLPEFSASVLKCSALDSVNPCKLLSKSSSNAALPECFSHRVGGLLEPKTREERLNGDALSLGTPSYVTDRG